MPIILIWGILVTYFDGGTYITYFKLRGQCHLFQFGGGEGGGGQKTFQSVNLLPHFFLEQP